MEAFNDGENMSVPEVEVETLRSIYLDELDVQLDEEGSISNVSIQLYPATADNVEEQYVTMGLTFIIPKEYPDSIPEMHIHNPRGLLDEQIDRITDNLLEIAENKKGSSMLFELIEAAKQQLTDENRPREDCAICLYGFFDEDVFMKTECYHYFHSHCLSRYVQCKLEEKKKEEEEEKKSAEQGETDSSDNVPCPVCRVPISFNSTRSDFPEPVGVCYAVVDIDSIVVDQMQEMNLIYKKQLEQGGIIDLEAESRKYLLEISNVPDDPITETGSSKVSSSTSKDSRADVSNGSSPGVRNRTSPNSTAYRARASNPQAKGGRNWKGKYQPRSRTDWSEYVEDSQKTDDAPSEYDVQSREPESQVPRGRRNTQNYRQRGGRSQRGPRFTGNYQNDNRYNPRNNGYRQGNFQSSRPYNRRNHANDHFGSRSSKSDALDFKENNSSSPDYSLDASESKRTDKSSNDNSNECGGGSQELENSSAERLDSQASDHERTSSSPARNQDWSSREVEEKPRNQRNPRRNNFRQKSQYSQERGSGKQYQNYRDESHESGTASQDASFSYSDSRNEKSQRYPGNRNNYRSNRGYDHRQYGDRRQNPNWKPRYNNMGPRHNHRNDTSQSSRNSYDKNMQSSIPNSSPENIPKRSISNGSCNLEREDDMTKVVQSDTTPEVLAVAVPMKVPQDQNDVSQGNELKSIGSMAATLRSPPGFANPHKKVIYGLPSVNPPPGFHQS